MLASQMPDTKPDQGDFVQLMINGQSRLYAFILSLVSQPEQASEVLQETNLVLWKKSDQFEIGTNFMAWAFRIARYQVMAHRQRLGRDRHVFDDGVVEQIAASFEKSSERFEERLAALSHCMKQLSEDAQTLVGRRYRDGVAVKSLAAELGQTANTIAVKLHRIRAALMQCIRKRQKELATP